MVLSSPCGYCHIHLQILCNKVCARKRRKAKQVFSTALRFVWKSDGKAVELKMQQHFADSPTFKYRIWTNFACFVFCCISWDRWFRTTDDVCCSFRPPKLFFIPMAGFLFFAGSIERENRAKIEFGLRWVEFCWVSAADGWAAGVVYK